MSVNQGKPFEDKFKACWKETFPNTFIFRLKDQMTGYKETSGNPCDFICFPGHNKLFMIECKEHKGASIPFTAIPQYERLLDYKNIDNVYAGVILWLSEKDTVTWMPIKEMEKAYEAGLKSLNPAVLMKNGYKFVNIPSEKLRVFMKSNYSILIRWAEEQN